MRTIRADKLDLTVRTFRSTGSMRLYLRVSVEGNPVRSFPCYGQGSWTPLEGLRALRVTLKRKTPWGARARCRRPRPPGREIGRARRVQPPASSSGGRSSEALRDFTEG